MAGENDPVDDLIEQVPDSEAPQDPPADPPADPAADPPAGKTVAKKDPPAQPPPVKRDVPLATFLEEKRKFTEALDRERGEREKLQKQIEALTNPPKAKPKFAEDPEGYIEHSTKASAQEVLKKLEETTEGLKVVKEKTEQDKLREQHNAFLEELGSMEEQFVQATPDYHKALAHVRQLSFAQMKEFYPDATDQQIMKAIETQEINLARQAMSQGRNPHELAYRLAVVNGYKKADPKTDPKTGKKGPEIKPEHAVLDPDLSLGKSAGEAPAGSEDAVLDPETYDPFEDALKEMFGRKRA
jgi:hypothetical protein